MFNFTRSMLVGLLSIALLPFVAAAEGAAPSGPAGSFITFAPLIVLFVIFYFLLIRPQQKKAKEHREMLTKLEKGDTVITAGGIHGTVTGVAEDTATVEISENVRVKVAKDYIVSSKKR